MPALIPKPSRSAKIAALEVQLLLDALYMAYGYDFRAYARASIERRIRQFMSGTEYRNISEIIPRLLHDEEFFGRLVRYFSIPVTELFRDPWVFRAVREQIIPLLRTWAHIKIWHAGCATGEEVYSMAILLKEEGLYDRTTIYATDFNEEALDRARHGIYGLDRIKDATRNYQQAGGKRAFSDYYHAAYNAAQLDVSLRERVVFSNHNLTADGVFGEMHLVFCRNVLIYFNRELQDRVLGLFNESLVHGGFLCLGTKEDVQFSASRGSFRAVDAQARLYKKEAG